MAVRIWGLALLGLGLAACGGGRPPPELEAETANAEVAVRIVNRHFSDVAVYLYRGTARHRLGWAGGNKSTLFLVPWRQVVASGPVRLFADQIGGSERVFSDELRLRPGDIVVWTLEAQLSRSMVAVY